MTYELEIGNIHPEAGEKDCVQTCGEYMLSLLERDEEYVLSCWKEGKKNLRKFWEKRKKKRRIQLLRKKLDRRRYQTFLELYRDFRHREPMHIRLKASLPKNNRVFYILFALGIILNLLAAGTLVCFLITGEVPLFRLFSGSLEKIGTVWMK